MAELTFSPSMNLRGNVPNSFGYSMNTNLPPPPSGDMEVILPRLSAKPLPPPPPNTTYNATPLHTPRDQIPGPPPPLPKKRTSVNANVAGSFNGDPQYDMRGEFPAPPMNTQLAFPNPSSFEPEDTDMLRMRRVQGTENITASFPPNPYAQANLNNPNQYGVPVTVLNTNGRPPSRSASIGHGTFSPAIPPPPPINPERASLAGSHREQVYNAHPIGLSPPGDEIGYQVNPEMGSQGQGQMPQGLLRTSGEFQGPQAQVSFSPNSPTSPTTPEMGGSGPMTMEVQSRPPPKAKLGKDRGFFAKLRRSLSLNRPKSQSMANLPQASTGGQFGLETGTGATRPPVVYGRGARQTEGVTPATTTPSDARGMMRCQVVMLDGTSKEFYIPKSSNGSDLFNQVMRYLDLMETDYFGLVYYDTKDVWYWLKLEKKISKQIGNRLPNFELQVKFYPFFPKEQMREDITRYLLTLQLRQDVLAGKLPASFLSLAILAAHIAQAELGDYDAIDSNREALARQVALAGTANQGEEGQGGLGNTGTSDFAGPLPWEYLKGMPLTPPAQQTPELMARVAELHKSLSGINPEEADIGFLENAKRLALYGVDFHQAKDMHDRDVLIGVSAAGILLYHDRLRIHRFSWIKIMKLSYKQKEFLLYMRKHSSETVQPALAENLQGTRTFSNPQADLAEELNDQHLSRHQDSNEYAPKAVQSKDCLLLSYKLPSFRLAKRLWRTCVEHHQFFRMKENESFHPQLPQRAPMGASQRRQPSLLKRFASYTTGDRFRYTGRTQSQMLSQPIGERNTTIHRLGPNMRSAYGDSWAALPDINNTLDGPSGAPITLPGHLLGPFTQNSSLLGSGTSSLRALPSTSDVEYSAALREALGNPIGSLFLGKASTLPVRSSLRPRNTSISSSVLLTPQSRPRALADQIHPSATGSIPVGMRDKPEDIVITMRRPKSGSSTPKRATSSHVPTDLELAILAPFAEDDRIPKPCLDRSEDIIIKQKSTARVVFIEEEEEDEPPGPMSPTSNPLNPGLTPPPNRVAQPSITSVPSPHEPFYASVKTVPPPPVPPISTLPSATGSIGFNLSWTKPPVPPPRLAGRATISEVEEDIDSLSDIDAASDHGGPVRSPAPPLKPYSNANPSPRVNGTDKSNNDGVTIALMQNMDSATIRK